MTPARPLRLAYLALAVLAVLVALPETAGADRIRVRVGGGVRVHGHVHIGGPRVHYRGRGRYRRPRVVIRYPRYYYYPGFYWGFRFASPPPPVGCHYECGPVPAYYYGHYGHRPPVAVATTVAAEPAFPRVGLGVFAGGLDVEGNDAGSDLGLLGRLRLTRRLLLEAEVSRTELADGARVDRRVGGALMFDFAPWSSLSPYVLGGGGFGQTDVDDGRFTAEQAYGELGVGLEWRLGRHLALFGDLRGGVRESNASEDELLLVRGGGDGPTVDDNERFTRARVGAMLYF